MKIKWRTSIFLILLAFIFTIGLTFVSVELPGVADSFLAKNVNFLDAATGLNAENDYITELYLNYYHLRLIGYISLAVIIILIIAGFITSKSGLSSTGAILHFLPVFGHFALTMFFLGGLGFTRLIWLPFIDISFEILHLGDIVLLPYRLLESIFTSLGVSVYKQLPYAITGIGLLIFMWGTLAWFYSKIKKKNCS